ncbi:MAG: ATP synthase F1 subunit epsilon [Oscillospiraceae bacterium]|nr:ATP synthase F1 subunit epsilon [Oscillospiraceae bacterium]
MKTFPLDILTPEHQFFSTHAEALTIQAPDGSLTILAGHAPLVAPFIPGSLSVKVNGEWKEAFHSSGFLEVLREGVIVFAQACEWPENIDEKRALEAKRRAEERLRQRQSINEHQNSQIALARAMVRLQLARKHINLD